MKTVDIKNTSVIALVDDEDFDLVIASGPWYLSHGRAVQHGYALGLTMQELILGKDSSREIDHIDHNQLNNQRNNLRYATRSQNTANRRRFKNNTSGYIGVAYHTRLDKYQAYVSKDKQIHFVGTFNTAIEAAKARDEKAKELHGEFSSLNFPYD